MSLIPLLPVDTDDPRIRAMFDEVSTHWDDIPNLYRVLAHSPEMFRAWLDFAWPLRNKATTTRRMRELMILEVARITGSAYEWAHHERMALEAGVTSVELEALKQGEIADSISRAERAAIDIAADIAVGPGMTRETFLTLEPHFTTGEAVELVMTASFYVCVARVLVSFDIELEEKYQKPW